MHTMWRPPLLVKLCCYVWFAHTFLAPWLYMLEIHNVPYMHYNFSLPPSLSFPLSLSLLSPTPSPLQLSFHLVLTSTTALVQHVRVGSRSLNQVEWERDGRELTLLSVTSRCFSMSPVTIFISRRLLLLTSLILGMEQFLCFAYD